MRCDGKYVDLDDNLTNLGSNIQKLDIVIDRLKASSSSRQRMCESIETALLQANNQVTFASLENETEVTLSSIFSCSQCDYAIDDVEPRMFSFNNPMGACETCNGLGKLDLFDKEKSYYIQNYLLPQEQYRDGIERIASSIRCSKTWQNTISSN